MTEEVNNKPAIRSLNEYQAVVQYTGGEILQKNRVGALTIVLGYRGLGHFETIMWDDRHPDFRDKGELITYDRTLESAEAFYFAYLLEIVASPFGQRTRERGKSWRKAAKEAMGEIKSDEVLFKDYRD